MVSGREKLRLVKLGRDPVLFGIGTWTMLGAMVGAPADSGDGNILKCQKYTQQSISSESNKWLFNGTDWMHFLHWLKAVNQIIQLPTLNNSNVANLLFNENYFSLSECNKLNQQQATVWKHSSCILTLCLELHRTLVVEDLTSAKKQTTWLSTNGIKKLTGSITTVHFKRQAVPNIRNNQVTSKWRLIKKKDSLPFLYPNSDWSPCQPHHCW